MGLDQFGIGTPAKKTTKRKVSKKSTSTATKVSNVSAEKEDPNGIVLHKFSLVCTNAKCKYQRTLKKRNLKEQDYICRKCGKEMKLKKE